MPRSHRALVIAAVWATIIFGTSCTFIERSVFIHFVERFLPSGMPRHLWVNFWGACGLLVVKAYHVTEYAVLCWLLQSVLRPIFKDNLIKALAVSAALAFLFAASDEWHQTFVPGRGGTWIDVVIDSLGIAIATGVTWRKLHRQQQSQEPTKS